MLTPPEEFIESLKRNASAFGIGLSAEITGRLKCYYEVLLKWNERLHLVAPCSAEEFATRHVLESMLLLRHLPPKARVIDIGSGAGLPIIPCLTARDDLRATLIEASRRKGVFLREALRLTGCNAQATLLVDRFERTTAPDADFVTSRALDGFQDSLAAIASWAPVTSTFLFFGGTALAGEIRKLRPQTITEAIPQSERRLLIIAPPGPDTTSIT